MGKMLEHKDVIDVNDGSAKTEALDVSYFSKIIVDARQASGTFSLARLKLECAVDKDAGNWEPLLTFSVGMTPPVEVIARWIRICVDSVEDTAGTSNIIIQGK